MSNFDFLRENEILKELADICIEAENGLNINNVTSAILTRRALEVAVKWLYANDNDLVIPYQDSLSALVHDISFRTIVDEKVLRQIDFIIKLGSYAVNNNKKIKQSEAILALRFLYNFTKWISYNYTDNYEERDFDETIIPKSSLNSLPLSERKSLFEELESKDRKLEDIRHEHNEQREQLTKKRKERKNNYNFNPKNISEAETRARYIDLELQLAGWDFDKNIQIELEVQGMPNENKIGYVDYVLMGKNGLPVAVVEAKKTSVNSVVGQNQAKLYADCIEQEYHQRPVIYYTNGFEIYMWDDVNYPPRRVYGYYTQDELELLISRRNNRNDLEHVNINKDITGREYQIEAIKSVCETLNEGHRKALIVMATGTGKTRTAISLVDVLTNNNWVKNVLFLADRTVLVKQAKNNFNVLLPNVSGCNLVTEKEDAENSRIVFSTYQTMINSIDSVNNKEGERLFTPGHFDLIIVDEAHRSIYNKYQAIFDYFDGFVVGLTATPRNDIDKNTYRFFEIENNVPTYMYEYEQAVKEGYLVDYHTIKTSTTFMDRGIKYNDLSDEEKIEYEDTFADMDGDEMPDEISSSAINTWLFNRDTVKQLLELLMEKGLKVEGEDKLGKTIIFAKNHKHAQMIVDTFNELYPIYKGEFTKLIDNQVKYSEDLIDKFSIKDSYPQIAVSVDMLDTGVDVPEVLNLVFFKPVKSKIKFWQMIGRGTRLCKNVFGAGKDKEQFYIFDYCRNFEFFSEQTKEIETGNMVSLTERIYRYKLDLIVELQNFKYQSEEFIKYRNELIDDFIEQISSLNRDSFLVKMKVGMIDKYIDKKNWNYISTIDYMDIKDNLISLFDSMQDDENAKRFDNLLYQLQVKRIKEENTGRCENMIIDIVSQLEKLGTVPMVYEKRNLIIEVAETDFIRRADFWQIEQVRQELRELIKLIEATPKNPVYTNFIDTLDIVDEEGDNIYPVNPSSNYKKKLEKFLAGNLENIVIHKIRHNLKLNEEDKKALEKILFEDLGNNREYAEAYGDTNIIKTVRNIVGLDVNTAREIFSKYVDDNRLNMKQIQFVKLLIDYVVKNGTIEMEKLTQQPFSIVGQPGQLFENNIDLFKEIKSKIDLINENAEDIA